MNSILIQLNQQLTRVMLSKLKHVISSSTMLAFQTQICLEQKLLLSFCKWYVIAQCKLARSSNKPGLFAPPRIWKFIVQCPPTISTASAFYDFNNFCTTPNYIWILLDFFERTYDSYNAEQLKTFIQGVFCDWCPPKKLEKYGKPRLNKSSSM